MDKLISGKAQSLPKAKGKAKSKAKSKAKGKAKARAKNNNDADKEKYATIITRNVKIFLAKSILNEKKRQRNAQLYADALRETDLAIIKRNNEKQAKKEEGIKAAKEKRKKQMVKFFDAADDGDEEELKKILKQGFLIDSVDGSMNSALSNAANQNQVNIVRLLLDEKANPNLQVCVLYCF